MNVSQVFKKHYMTSAADTWYKGFLVKMSNVTSGSARVYMREQGYYLPSLQVTYGPTQFGVYASIPDDDINIIEGRLLRAKNDKFNIVRYLAEKDYGWFNNYAHKVSNQGLKQFIHFPYGLPTKYPTSDSFTNYVKAHLTSSPNYLETVFAVEIGGEEEGAQKWWEPLFQLPTPDGWFGNVTQGNNFALFSIPTLKAIKANWPKMEIYSGGAMYQHESIDYTLDSGGYGNAGHFLRGYISKAIEMATQDRIGKYDYLPETISIHGYAKRMPPEYTIYNPSPPHPQGKKTTLWIERLKKLCDICGEYGYIPNFAITEYGFSPSQKSDAAKGGDNRNFYAPDNPSQKSFSVYYLRSCLMNSTIQPYFGIGWKLSSYFQHSKGAYWWQNSNGVWEWRDFGFHKDEVGDPVDPPYGDTRPIKSIAQSLFDPIGGLKLQNSDTTVWVKTQFDLIYSADHDYYAWCAWKKGDGNKWGAIWRFRYGTIDGDNWDRKYYEPSGSMRKFIVSGNQTSLSPTLYRFNIGTTSATLFPTGDPVTNKYPDGGNTVFEIPNVTDNPILIRFY